MDKTVGQKVLSIKLVNYSSWQLYYFLLSAVLAHVLLLILLQIKILFYVVMKVNASNKKALFGNGCGSVGRAVASESRGPRFESSHWQTLLNICLLSTVLKRQK